MIMWSPSWVMSLSGFNKVAIFLMATFTSATGRQGRCKINRREGPWEAGLLQDCYSFRHIHICYYCTDTVWDLNQNTRWLQSHFITVKTLGFLWIVEHYLQLIMSTLISKLDICDLMMICLLPCLYQAIIPCYSQLTKGLQVLLEVVIGNHFPISIQISWHVGSFSAGFLTSGERGGLLWTATCDRVQNLLSKSLNLNQTRFNPIICVFFFSFFLENVRTSHFPPLNPHHTFLTCRMLWKCGMHT